MNKNLFLTIIVIIAVVLSGVLYFGYTNGSFEKIISYFNKPKIEIAGAVLFYGEGCSHCKNVDDFILSNKVEDKIKFTRLEIFNNKINSDILIKKASACGLPTDKIGVPFLWDGKTCIIGDVDIIKYFQDKLNAK